LKKPEAPFDKHVLSNVEGLPMNRSHAQRYRPGRCPGLMNGRPVGAAVLQDLNPCGLSPEGAASHEPRATPWATETARVHWQPVEAGVAFFSGLLAPAAGKCTWNVVPRPALGVALRRPPWSSMMERLMARPIPMPSGLLV
jgi:hypothetical protein